MKTLERLNAIEAELEAIKAKVRCAEDGHDWRYYLFVRQRTETLRSYYLSVEITCQRCGEKIFNIFEIGEGKKAVKYIEKVLKGKVK